MAPARTRATRTWTPASSSCPGRAGWDSPIQTGRYRSPPARQPPRLPPLEAWPRHCVRGDALRPLELENPKSFVCVGSLSTARAGVAQWRRQRPRIPPVGGVAGGDVTHRDCPVIPIWARSTHPAGALGEWMDWQASDNPVRDSGPAPQAAVGGWVRMSRSSGHRFARSVSVIDKAAVSEVTVLTRR